MQSHRYNYHLRAGALLFIFIAGCQTPRLQENVPLNAQEQHAFFSKAQDERAFWLTRYESEHGPVFSNAHRVHTEKIVQVPLETSRHHALPMITVRLRGLQEFAAALDTSSRANWIEFGVAMEAGLIPLGPPPVALLASQVDDPVPGFLCVASRLAIDTLQVQSALFFVKGAHGSLNVLLRHPPRADIPMVLGAPFLRAFRSVQFDFTNHMLTLATTRSYTPDEDRLVATVPFRVRQGHLVAEGVLGHESTWFLLDTLGDYALATNREKVGAFKHRVMLGDLVLRHVAHTPIESLALGMPDVPRVGRRVLERYIVTFDNQNNLIYFERP